MTAEPACPFCSVPPDRILHTGKIVLALWDGFPISPGHALIVTRRHVGSWFDATPDERAELLATIDRVRDAIQQRHTPDGFNIGINDGPAAGQTIRHLHLHVIPRYDGDVPDPRGGIRHVIPQKADYWSDAESAHVVAPVLTGAPGEAPVDRALVHGEDDPLLPHLVHHLDQATWFRTAVAFVMRSGVDLVEPHLRDLVDRGGRAEILTGDYLDATDPDALQRLLDLQQQVPGAGSLDLRVFETRGGRAFHPKTYVFGNEQSAQVAYVGSSNLSGSALREGVEWNYRVIPARDQDGLAEIQREFRALWVHANTRALDQAWLDDYRRRRQALPLPVEVRPEPPEKPAQPHSVQQEALAALEATRADGNSAGLVVLATGLGKTWLSAFDCNRPEFRRVLFVAHREEILSQAMRTFRRIRPQAHLGMYTGKEKVPEADILFASIQTLGRLPHLRQFERSAFDYIVVDEFHHAAARTYRQLIDHFEPGFLLGLTATPERTDGGDLLALCQQNLVYRRDVAHGIREGLLCPFRYFGVPDEVDYSNIPWRSRRFDEEALTAAVATQQRAENALEQYRRRAGARTLAFCCSQRHADFMAEYFSSAGVGSVAVHAGAGSAPRATSLERLEAGALDVVFAVDMFNEGVDVPNIDTVLMLRPTESQILWMQQFGRGLRCAPGKKHLTVIDYIGNHRIFLLKPQTLLQLGTGDHEVERALALLAAGELELPSGCEVTYELEAVDILKGLLRRRAPHDALVAAYEDFKARHVERPTASEMYHEGYTPRSTRKSHGSWLAFVRDRGDMTERQIETFESAKPFLESIDSTPMTRSYKMLVLLAMLKRGALPGGIPIVDLVDEFGRVARRSHQLTEELEGKLGDPDALRRLIEQNPIEAWTGGKGTGGRPYFRYDGGVFSFAEEISAETRAPFQELVRELVDWRLAEYLDRSVSTVGEEAFRCKVSHSGRRPILFLPDRDTNPGVPTGWTEVEADGERYDANFVKVAVNVMRKPGAKDNVLPELLRGWFGEDAGRPGTNSYVVCEKGEGLYVVRPERRSG